MGDALSAPPDPSPPEALRLAARHLVAGERAEAAAVCRKVLAAVPDHAAALNMLGGCALLDGAWKQAAACFDALLARDPEQPVYLANKGALLLAVGAPGPAVEFLRKAVAARPDMAPALDHLGRALQALDRWDEALEAFDAAVAADPAYRRARTHRGGLYRHEREEGKALAELEQARRLAPDDPDTLAEIGTLHVQNAFLSRARPVLEKALALDPDHVAARLAHTTFLDMAGRSAEARSNLCRAIARRPDSVMLRTALADLLANLGEADDAAWLLRDVLDAQPGHVGALGGLAGIGRLDPDSAEAGRMARLAAQDTAPPLARASLHFALGQTFDRHERYDEAFAHFEAANRLRLERLRRLGKVSGIEARSAYTRALRAVFDADFFAARRGWGEPTRRPVFIAGMPRSGTTLVEQILAGHPRVAAAGELMDLPHLAMIVPAVSGAKVPFPACAAALSRPAAARLARAYDARLRDWAPAAARVTNKLPGNFAFLGLAALLFPNATFIHCRRDARDTCLANWVANFNDAMVDCFDLERQGRAWLDYAALMEHWDMVLPVTLLAVDYEAVVADPEAQARRLVEHCGLDWDPACLEFHRVHRSIRTASREQVRRSIYTTSVGRWRHYAARLGPLLAVLGETPAPTDEAAAPPRNLL